MRGPRRRRLIAAVRGWAGRCGGGGGGWFCGRWRIAGTVLTSMARRLRSLICNWAIAGGCGLGGWATERERGGFGEAIVAEESLVRSAEMREMKAERIVRQRCILAGVCWFFFWILSINLFFWLRWSRGNLHTLLCGKLTSEVCHYSKAAATIS